jgi:hypothetical protein
LQEQEKNRAAVGGYEAARQGWRAVLFFIYTIFYF